jgi:hypothetical protein
MSWLKSAVCAAWLFELEPEMEKLIYYIAACAVVASLAIGFIGGAIGNLFGFGFWTPACICGGLFAAFTLGRIIG